MATAVSPHGGAVVRSALVHAYENVGWDNFFVAEAGASAALTGLLFVAVSINLAKVLAFPQLPGRAGEALVILAGVLVTSTLGLVPGQSHAQFGAELLAVGGVVWLFPVLIQLRVPRVPDARRSWMVTRVVAHQMATLPLLAAGASLLVGAGGGLYWLVPATVLSFAAGIVNSWVLLVEIHR